jgi:molybdate transport system substrate-binding protein
MGRVAAALLVVGLVLPSCRTSEGPVVHPPLRVAVAANFAATMGEIEAAFEADSEQSMEVSIGSTGALDAQIRNGAPFDVFLAADQERPARLEREGLAVRGSRFTYAVGRLALYGKGLRHPDDARIDLESPDLHHLAIANPETAPYGVAAREVLKKLGLFERLEPHLVKGESVAQTYQFVKSEGAELGFLPLSSVVGEPSSRYWLVPAALHRPIQQDAVLCAGAREHPTAKRFLRFLKGKAARAIIERAGYGVP